MAHKGKFIGVYTYNKQKNRYMAYLTEGETVKMYYARGEGVTIHLKVLESGTLVTTNLDVAVLYMFVTTGELFDAG
jgi:hypothetical protein